MGVLFWYYMNSVIEGIYALYTQYPSISTDTRDIKQDSIFFALKGANFDGNTFARQALDLGAKYSVIDDEKFVLDGRCILVNDVLETLQGLAKYHRMQLKVPVVAITGSNGKTTTKELVSAVLKKKFKTYFTQGNLNNHIGVPLTLLSVTKDTEIAVIEMGANHQGEIELLCNIAQPDYGLITNIGKAHLEGFGGIDGIIKGKGELYKFLKSSNGITFVNSDSDILIDMSKGMKTITYGTSGKSEFRGELLTCDAFVSFNFIANNLKTKITSNLVGDYNIANLLVACTIGSYFNIPQDKIKEAIEEYIPTNNRSQILKLENKTLILDAYNANPSSMEAAILNFSNMALENKVLILGDMLELGHETEKEHQNITNLISSQGFGNVFLVGKYFWATKNSFEKHKTSEALISSLEKKNLDGCSILIKGSRGIKLEKVAEFFQQNKEA